MTELVTHVRARVLVAVAVAVLAPLFALMSLDVPGRPVLALAFFLLVPGVAFAEVLRLPSELASWCIAIALSLATNILAAQIALVLDFWHPVSGQTVIALASLVLVAIAVRRDRHPAGTS